MRKFLWICPLTALAAVLPVPALAYIGPGAGLGMLGSLLAVIGAVLVALFGLVMFPIMLLRKRRNNKTRENKTKETEAAASPATPASDDVND